MTTFAEFANKCQKAAPNLREAQKRGLGAGAFVVKQTIQAQPGYANRLRGVGQKGAKLNVRYTVLDKAAVVFAVGPFHLLERDTKSHRIQPKARRRGGKRAILTPAGPRAYANHPGTRGKHPFARGVDVARPLVGRAIHAEMSRGLVKAFK